MTDQLTLIAKIYLATGAFFAVWLIMMGSYQLDQFDRQNLKKSHAVAILLLCVFAWPLALIHRPKALFSVRALAPIDFRSAAFMRERYKLSQALPHCSSLIRFSQMQGGIKLADHFFSPAEIESTAVKPIKRNWRSSQDDSEIIRWVRTADLSDTQPVYIPWVWTGFVALADEILRRGLGRTHCMKCNREYTAAELSSRDQKTAEDHSQKKLLCPEGHIVLEFQDN